ncbi:MAG: DUF554 domain-containing protein [Acutalibacteraceae bacterium]|nr:DUF554 domain-containing protein [Acutalibacteraceae bacterium]
MIGVIVNTITVIIGSIIGMLGGKLVPERVNKAVMVAIGLCTVYIGVDGALAGSNTLILIISLVLGTIVGTLIDIDKGINWLGDTMGKRFKSQKGNFAEGFVTASLVFCIGSMTIVGSLKAGIEGDNSMIFTKSLLDLISSSMLASALGVGVLVSAVFVLVFQGALVLLAGLLEPILNDFAVSELICVGSVMIIGLGLNLIGVTKIKVANMLPALIFAPVICKIYELIV